MEQWARWWTRRCFKYQARKSPRKTVRWPVVGMPLPNSSGDAIAIDHFAPLPVCSTLERRTPKNVTVALPFRVDDCREAGGATVGTAPKEWKYIGNMYMNPFFYSCADFSLQQKESSVTGVIAHFLDLPYFCII